MDHQIFVLGRIVHPYLGRDSGILVDGRAWCIFEAMFCKKIVSLTQDLHQTRRLIYWMDPVYLTFEVITKDDDAILQVKLYLLTVRRRRVLDGLMI